MKTGLVVALCALCALVGAGAAAHEPPPAALRIDRQSIGWPLPEFALLDQHGDRLDRARLLGQWNFVVFGDTRCGEPCLDALRTLSLLRERIAGTRHVHSTQLIFVTLDPQRDDGTRLARYLAPFDEAIVAARGSPDMTRLVADELGASERQQRAAGHDGSLVLIGPEGDVRAVYLPPYDPRRLTADYLLQRSRRR